MLCLKCYPPTRLHGVTTQKTVISGALFHRIVHTHGCSNKDCKGPASWSELLTTNHEVPGSIPGSTVGIVLEGEDTHGDHGLGRLVEFRFKAPPGTASSSITTHTSSGQRNCATCASQPQKSVTLLPCPRGRTKKSTKDMWWHLKKTMTARKGFWKSLSLQPFPFYFYSAAEAYSRLRCFF